MKLPIIIIILLLSIFGFTPNGQQVYAQSTAGGERTHIDFLPRYLKKNPNVIICRVDYHVNKMVLHFRYIAPSKDTVYFYGKQHANAWVIQTIGAAARSGANYIQKTGDVCNIRINDQLKASWLPSNQEIGYIPEKGDIVSCEIHVERMPHFVKTIHIEGGDNRISGDRFLCNSLMLKSVESDALGSLDKMEVLVDNFYKEFDYVRYPNLKYLSSIENEKLSKADAEKIDTPIQGSMEKVNYMPKMLNRMEDMECKERIILRNVYFEDNSAEFTKRVVALKTIQIVYDYMRYFPESKIILHGHTDVFGNPYENLVLSKERVLAVKRVLVQKGIDKHRIVTLFHGGEQPLPNCENGHELNRRVEVEVVCEDGTGSTSQAKH